MNGNSKIPTGTRAYARQFTVSDPDLAYVGLPWRYGGADRTGLDCRGLAQLWLRENGHLTGELPESPPAWARQGYIEELLALGGHGGGAVGTPRPTRATEAGGAVGTPRPTRDTEVGGAVGTQNPTRDTEAGGEVGTPRPTRATGLNGKAMYGRGDLILMREGASGRLRHLAVALDEVRILHILDGVESRIDNGLTLCRRLGLEPAMVLHPHETVKICAVLADPRLGSWVTVILLVISLALSAASAFLMPKPKIGQFRNETGRYGFDQLFTRNNSTLPLPEALGAITVAGNSPYQSLIDKTQAATDGTTQKSNKLVALASGPIEDFEYNSFLIKVNGLPYTHTHFHPSGFKLNPAQTKAEAVDGTIASESNRPSITSYTGSHGITVPVDVRAQYDRGFPVYGFAGSAYLVFRLINSTKFPSFNINVTVKGRKCRTFTAAGFVQTTVTGEALAGADGAKVRFKLANEDVVSVTTLTVDGVGYAEVAAAGQAGNVYQLNRTKGFVEFVSAPGAAAAVSITYKYYPRAWTQNPAAHLGYLLTEKGRGKGVDESKINWTAAVALRDYCDELVTWVTANGPVTGARFACNYALDYRKPIQDHLRAVLDTCYAYLFVSGGRFVMKARKAESSVFAFTQANILKDSFHSEMLDRAQMANRVQVFYHSLDTYNAETAAVRDDPVNQRAREARLGNGGVVEETLHLLGVDSQAQAEMLAETLLRENVNTRWVCELKTTVKGLALEPGDVVDVTHSSQPAWAAKLFRIEDVTHDESDNLTLRCSEYFGAAYA